MGANGTVYLSNRFIRECRFGYTMLEWRLFIRMASQVNKFDKPDTVYSMNAADLAHAIGLKVDGRRTTITQIKNKIKCLADKSFWFEDGARSRLVRALDNVTYEARGGQFTFTFGQNIRDLLYGLDAGYIAFDSAICNSIDSTFVLKLYLLLKSYASLGALRITTESLMDTLYERHEVENKNTGKRTLELVNQGKSVGKLTQRIKEALEIIGALTDLSASVEYIKGEHSKAIIGFVFEIKNGGGKCGYYDAEGTPRSIAKQRDTMRHKLISAAELGTLNHGCDEIMDMAKNAKERSIISSLVNCTCRQERKENAQIICLVYKYDDLASALQTLEIFV